MDNPDIESEIRRLVAAANNHDQVDRSPKQISCRVDAMTHHKLGLLADKVNMTRTGLAEHLLAQATAIAWTAAGFQELSNDEIATEDSKKREPALNEKTRRTKSVTSNEGNFSRINCINVVFGHFGLQTGVARDSGAIAVSSDNSTRICCLTSKNYDHGENEGEEERYWFTIYERQLDEISLSERAFVALGCGSTKQIIVIPAAAFLAFTPDLPPYTRGGIGWHIHLRKAHGKIDLRREGRHESPIDITRYLI